MGNIDTKRITSVSDGGNAVPVQWSVNATDIKYNNAIIMATTIARRIDKQYLWNGLITNTEKVGYFNINPPTKITHFTFKDNLICKVQDVEKYSFIENVSTFSINKPEKIQIGAIKEYFPIPTAAKLPLGTTPLLAENLSKNTLFIEMRNPINIGNSTEEANLLAFKVIVTVNMETYYPEITTLELTGQNTIVLTLNSEIMAESTQVITVLYDSSLGTLEDSFNGDIVASFQTSFNYEEKETTE